MNIGFHISTKDIKSSIKEIEDIKFNCIQVFTKSPRRPSTNILFKTKEIELIRKHNLITFVHSPYYVNLVKYTKSKRLNMLSIKTINDDINFLRKLGNKGIGTVIHLGSTTKSFHAEENYVNDVIIEYLLKIIEYSNIKNTDPKLIIENRAMAGQQILINTDEMISLSKLLKIHKIDDRVTFCFDTCHDFVSMYKESHKKVGKNWYKIENTIRERIDNNLQKLLDNNVTISVVHLNDAKSYTKDEHENLLDGYIPEDELIGVIRICKKNKIPMIIERIDASTEERKKMIKIVHMF